MQLIPSLDLYQGRLVRLRHGDPKQATFYDLTPEGWIRQLADAGAKRIHLVDLDGAFGQPRQGRFASLPLLFPEIHFQVGGGLRDRGAIEEVLALGFDAVVGTLAVEQPAALKGLPGDRVIAALDLRGDRIATRGWQAPSATESKDVFAALLGLGFHRALVTDVSRDGTLEGPGIEAAAWDIVAKSIQWSYSTKEKPFPSPVAGSKSCTVSASPPVFLTTGIEP